jgi:hypothetical protein
VYQDSFHTELTDNHSAPVTEHIQNTDLALMSEEWRSQISEAALESDRNRVIQLIQEIPNQESDLVKILEKFTRQFEFDEMLEFLS